MAYSDRVIDHYNNPRNVGSLDKNAEDVGTGIVGAPECGDVMKLQIRVEEDRIVDAKFKTFGCGSAIASSSLATEMLKGKTLDEAFQIKNSQLVDELSLPPVKIHCSVLAEDAIKAAITDFRKKEGLGMIQITEKATEEFKRIMREENDGDAHGIRIGIKGGGCSGFSYVMQFEKEAREFDRVFQADDVPIFIDAKSLVYLSGIEIDYETDLLNRGFKFNNPNAVKSCGCGTSFAV